MKRIRVPQEKTPAYQKVGWVHVYASSAGVVMVWVGTTPVIPVGEPPFAAEVFMSAVVQCARCPKAAQLPEQPDRQQSNEAAVLPFGWW